MPNMGKSSDNQNSNDFLKRYEWHRKGLVGNRQPYRGGSGSHELLPLLILDKRLLSDRLLTPGG